MGGIPVKLTPEQKHQIMLTARNLKKVEELKKKYPDKQKMEFPNSEITAMDEAQIQKMQDYNQRESLAVAEMMKSPLSSEEMDKVAQDHYDVHGQVNPNKKDN